MARKSRYAAYAKMLLQEHGLEQKTSKRWSVVSKIKRKKK
jgi:hypothetical protein